MSGLAACTAEGRPQPLPSEPDTQPEDIFPEPPIVDEPPQAGEWLFETDELRQISLTIGEAELESLARVPDAWVPADLEVAGLVLEDVAIRLKGNGSFQPIDAKPSFKIHLDKYVVDQELDGLDELVLNNMSTDASYLRERLAYAVYREVGVPAARANHVWVVVNGEPYGLYLAVEAVDGRFLDRWFEVGDGPLYEMFDVDLTPPEVWHLEHDGGPDDRSAVVGLAAVLADPASLLVRDGADYLDVDQFATYFGASAVVGQFDAYPYSVPGDDVYLYVHPDDDRIRFVAHGADETFSDADRPADYVFGLLALRCLEDPLCEERWAAGVWGAMDAVEAMDLGARADAWAEALRPHVEADPRSPFTRKESGGAQEAVHAFIEGRRAALEAMPGVPDPPVR